MKHFYLLLICLIGFSSYSQTDDEPSELSEEELRVVLDSINNSFTYQYGEIDLKNGLATLHVPDGFKFLDGEQSEYVLTELWGNPPGDNPIGLLFPEDMTPFHDEFTYCVEITYSEDGYIEDDDAKDLDYSDLLEDMQEDILAQNPEREAQGYEAMELIGWASPPFYDSENKKLHWAKELKFEGYEANTLNYDIRVLGRKGYLNLTAIGDIYILDAFNEDRDNILASVEFNDGNRYADFNPDIDEVAAYGIGGLIAGKILAKAGFFALILKFWKFIAIGAVAIFGGFRKKIFGGGKSDDA
ncbi:DUF2167 domain-containing protein [Psychroserpens sp.]|uniref:DUF2167 domain-containing protein n=1 Tax=Psychroserpens sp. TaxID=2020870 RepID=UPI002B2787CA|nr:DUF2167 domain-containing protein [Psychroserpens sp.]